MAEHRWSLICQSVRTDANNNLDLTGVIDEVHVAPIPSEVTDGAAVALDAQVVSVWHRDTWDTPERLQMRLVFHGPRPNLDRLGETQPFGVNVWEYPVVRVSARLPPLPLRGFGVYRIRIEKRRDEGAPWVHAGGDITLGIWEAPAGAAIGATLSNANVASKGTL